MKSFNIQMASGPQGTSGNSFQDAYSKTHDFASRALCLSESIPPLAKANSFVLQQIPLAQYPQVSHRTPNWKAYLGVDVQSLPCFYLTC